MRKNLEEKIKERKYQFYLVLIFTLITSLVFKNRENFKNVFTKKNKIKAPQASTADKLNIGEIVKKATESIKNNETLPEEAKKEIETQMEEKKEEVKRVVENKVQERKQNNNQVQKPVVSVQEKPKAEVKPAPTPTSKPKPKPENKPAEKPKQKV